ncbi:MAG: two pore domain potassium channel family protein [Acidobacteria bacterium]|jgi:Ion channel|nr:MAG: two pore domain potassium channel family protein [Acidobacteriota bacterium]
MNTFWAICGIVIIVLVLSDAFETVVLPRRVTRQFRLTAWFYRRAWRPWAALARRIKKDARRESFLGYFGPLSLILLLVLWAGSLIFGFALLQFGAGRHLKLSGEPITFGLLLYHSGETFFTLGYGDIIPESPFARALAVTEAGTGFGFLAIVIGYLPTIYSGFSRREIEISRLDARAGSPPTAAELLLRFGKCPQQSVLDEIFRDWERWSAEVLESHLSYGVLGYFRSQHINQSWLGALTTILDATALVMAGIGDIKDEQASLTFSMARHAVVDLAQVYRAQYNPDYPDRLPEAEFARLRQMLADEDLKIHDDPEFLEKLAHLRSMYEAYAYGLAQRLVIMLPPWVNALKRKDNWEAGPWDRLIQARGLGEHAQKILRVEDHF